MEKVPAELERGRIEVAKSETSPYRFRTKEKGHLKWPFFLSSLARPNLRRKGWPCACFKYRCDHKCLKAVSDMVCVLQSRATSRPPRHRRAPLKPYSERNGIAPA